MAHTRIDELGIAIRYSCRDDQDKLEVERSGEVWKKVINPHAIKIGSYRLQSSFDINPGESDMIVAIELYHGKADNVLWRSSNIELFPHSHLRACRQIKFPLFIWTVRPTPEIQIVYSKDREWYDAKITITPYLDECYEPELQQYFECQEAYATLTVELQAELRSLREAKRVLKEEGKIAFETAKTKADEAIRLGRKIEKGKALYASGRNLLKEYGIILSDKPWTQGLSDPMDPTG